MESLEKYINKHIVSESIFDKKTISFVVNSMKEHIKGFQNLIRKTFGMDINLDVQEVDNHIIVSSSNLVDMTESPIIKNMFKTVDFHVSDFDYTTKNTDPSNWILIPAISGITRSNKNIYQNVLWEYVRFDADTGKWFLGRPLK